MDARDEEISRRNLSSRGFGDDTNQGTHKVTNGLSVQNDGCEMGAFERYCYGQRVDETSRSTRLVLA